MKAKLARRVDPEWARLRAWAADVRDLSRALVQLLDAQHDAPSPETWESCRALAARLRRELGEKA